MNSEPSKIWLDEHVIIKLCAPPRFVAQSEHPTFPACLDPHLTARTLLPNVSPSPKVSNLTFPETQTSHKPPTCLQDKEVSAITPICKAAGFNAPPKMQNRQADVFQQQPVPTPSTTRSPRRRRKSLMKTTLHTRRSSLPVRNHFLARPRHMLAPHLSTPAYHTTRAKIDKG
jgi:hypothetical protein